MLRRFSLSSMQTRSQSSKLKRKSLSRFRNLSLSVREMMSDKWNAYGLLDFGEQLSSDVVAWFVLVCRLKSTAQVPSLHVNHLKDAMNWISFGKLLRS